MRFGIIGLLGVDDRGLLGADGRLTRCAREGPDGKADGNHCDRQGSWCDPA
jgi:hypothetical protein